MDHVAIMNKSWDLIPKILNGRKQIESRWGINRCTPWGKVNKGDNVYFKNSGEPVTAIAKVKRIKEFQGLDKKKIVEILKKYGGDKGICISNLKTTLDWAKRKRYCTLIYLKNAKRITKPFNINKIGFGSGAAWITVKDVKTIKIS